MLRKYELTINDTTINVEVDGPNNGILNVTIGEATFPVQVADEKRGSGTFKVTVGDVKHTIHIAPQSDTQDYKLTIKKQTYAAHLKSLISVPSLSVRPTTISSTFEAPTPSTATPIPTEPGAVTAPLPGRVLEVQVKEGQQIKSGDVLLVLEAMKMANEIRAPQDGAIKTVHVKAGDTVEKGQPMITIH